MSKTGKLFLLISLLTFCTILPAQEENKPDPEEMLAKELDRLTFSLKLEDWQVYYVDSILHNDYYGMVKELEGMQKSRVSNPDLYQAVQDKWMESTQKAYQKYFSAGQWALYLKQGGQRVINEREKRRARQAGIKDKKKK